MHGQGSSSPTSVTIEAGAIVVSGVSDPMAAAEEAIRLLSQRIGRLTRAPGRGGRCDAASIHQATHALIDEEDELLKVDHRRRKYPYWRDNHVRGEKDDRRNHCPW